MDNFLEDYINSPVNDMLSTYSPQISSITASFTVDALLEKLAVNLFSGCVRITQEFLSWQVYFDAGSLVFITNSVDPFERLERYLRTLGHNNSQINKNVLATIRFNFDSTVDNQESCSCLPADYRAIEWLKSKNFIDGQEARYLVKKITEEAGESCLLPTQFSHELLPGKLQGEILISQNLLIFLNNMNSRLKQWESLFPHITSGYDRPYIISQDSFSNEEKHDRLHVLLCGYNLYQLSALLNKDPLHIAQLLMPMIVDGRVIMRPASSIFSCVSQLLKFRLIAKKNLYISAKSSPLATKLKIVCIDDSSAMLQQIKLFLKDIDCEIVLINDSVKALMEIARIKPSMIIMDIEMKSLDGYQLCKLLRNHSLLKSIPIVMLTGNNSLFARIKANISGATDYLTKPFQQSELTNMVYRYLG